MKTRVSSVVLLILALSGVSSALAQSKPQYDPEELAKEIARWKEEVRKLEAKLDQPGVLWILKDDFPVAVETDIPSLREDILLVASYRRAWQSIKTPEDVARVLQTQSGDIWTDIYRTADEVYDRLVQDHIEITRKMRQDLKGIKETIRFLEEKMAEASGKIEVRSIDPKALERDKKTMLGELDTIRQREGWHANDHVLVAGEINSARRPEDLRAAGALIIGFSKCYQDFNAQRAGIIERANTEGWMPGRRIAAIDRITAVLNQCKNAAFNKHAAAKTPGQP